MTKKEYLKPEMVLEDMDMNELILSGSVNSVTTTGLGDEEELELPDESQPTTGSVWNDAW